MKIAIIGAGYVGLVTGSCFSEMSNYVTCVDIDEKKITQLNKGVIPIYEPRLSKLIKNSMKNGNINFSTDIEKSIKNNDIIFIAVGTPMNNDGSSNLKYVRQVSESIGKYINKHKIIVTKSTIPVGATNKVKNTIQKEIDKRNENIPFHIANNPEFLKQGTAVSDFMSPDRIVIGLENDSVKNVFKELYKPFSINHEKLIFMDIRSSELTKYASNAMLATKISFINEMAIIAEKVGADINDVRKGIGSDSRIGYSFIYPSVGYGGSCFPKDVHAILNFSNEKKYNPRILEAVNKVNDNQKKYFFNKIVKRFSQNNKFSGNCFGIWGLSFKPGTDDMRDSASIYIVNEIIKLGGSVKVYDPKAIENAKLHYFKDLKNIKYCNDKYEVLENSDALILLTEWPEFRSPDMNIIKSKLNTHVIFDGRNQYDKETLKKIGIEYHQIGVHSLL